MAGKKDNEAEAEVEANTSAYATGPDQPGKPLGPEHDASFHTEPVVEEVAEEEAPKKSSSKDS